LIKKYGNSLLAAVIELCYNYNEIKYKVWNPYGRIRSVLASMIGFRIGWR
jgi:hypothetical protein